MQDDQYFECPHCGALVPMGAAACGECGSDAETGWAEDIDYGDFGTGYNDQDDFDYDEFLKREFPEATDVSARQAALRWILVVVVAILCLGLLMLGMR